MHYALHSDPRSSHQQIARLLRRLGRDPILDVGAAQGALGTLLAEDGLVLDAVEPNPEWAEHARPHYRRVVTGPIEAAELEPASYRVVVCADVLEHLPDPLDALRKLRAAATPDALFVVSLPNVAHLSARLLLLFGRFPEMERGIFDRTHLHFYTRDTAVGLLRSAGLRVDAIRATPVPLEQVWPPRASRRLLAWLMGLQAAAVRLVPTLFAFQWILVARQEGSRPPRRGA